MMFSFAMPGGARRRSETYELGFFKKILLFRHERVKRLKTKEYNQKNI